MNRIVLIFLILATTPVLGQSDLLKGKLIDAQTIEPVAFATIAVKGGTLGVISNADGSFQIPQKFNTYGDTLQISSMGYEKREVLISTLSIDVARRIYLKPALFELEETVVRGKKKRRLSARKIVQRAIANIPNNYPDRLSSTVGYYRDYQLKKDNYINLNEAIFEVYDQGFSTVDSLTTKVQIYNYKKNNDFERDTLADDSYDYKRFQKFVDNAFLRSYGGNEFIILRVHDAVRNYNRNSYSFVNRFDLDLLNNHQFFRDSSTYINGEAVYTVKFRKVYPNYTAHGELYISHGDFAIHKMEYTVYDDRKKIPDRKLNKHDGRGQLLFNVVTEYRRKYNKMYLNYISFHNSFVVNKPPKFTLDSTLVNAPVAYYVSYFNKPVDTISAKRLKNYEINFDQKKYGIDKVEVFQDSVRLYADSNFKKAMANYRWEMSALMRKGKNAEVEELFSIAVKNIRDIEGNLVNESEIEEYLQFREYFVQQVKPNSTLPVEIEFMNKRKPIFKDQPIVRPYNFDDYWMNTPLPPIKD